MLTHTAGTCTLYPNRQHIGNAQWFVTHLPCERYKVRSDPLHGLKENILALPWVGPVSTENYDWVITVWELLIQCIRCGNLRMYSFCTPPVGPVSVPMYTKPLMSSTLIYMFLLCIHYRHLQTLGRRAPLKTSLKLNRATL